LPPIGGRYGGVPLISTDRIKTLPILHLGFREQIYANEDPVVHVHSDGARIDLNGVEAYVPPHPRIAHS